MSDLIQLDNLPVEALAEMANEAAAACEASGRKTVEHAATCGRALLAIRPQIPHGQWMEWLAENFSQSRQRAQQFMEIANCYARSNLESAETIQGALRMIAESPEKQAKKAHREAKKLESPPTSLTPVTPAPPVSVGTIRNENPPTLAPPAKLGRPAWLADPDEMGMPDVDAMPPLPRTNTHHTAANRRTPDARETDRVGLVSPDDPRTLQDGHWYTWSEDRNRLLPVSDEEILRRADEIRGQLVAEHAVTTTPVVEHKSDSVSSKPGKVPTVQQLGNILRHRQYGDPFWTDDMVAAVDRWIGYKQSLTGKAKIRSVQQWEVALTRIENVAAAKGWPAVADMIEKAIANGWQGWEHETNGSRSGSRISTAVRSDRNWDEEIPEWKPTE